MFRLPTNRLIALIVGIILVMGAVSFANAHVALAEGTVTDVSWPNCKITPQPYSTWGVVGVSGGLDFHTNPCLSQEFSWFTHSGLYVNTGYPGLSAGKHYQSYPRICRITESDCLAYNYGYNATLAAIRYANSQQVQSTQWWLDVETENSWSNNVYDNRASLQGVIDAISQNTFMPTIGIYSTTNQWSAITGGWHNYVPVWVATGGTSRAIAEQYCEGENFTGGQTELTQYTMTLDENVTCNTGYAASLVHF